MILASSAAAPHTLDPRLNALRPDLADIKLRGKVDAALFVEGVVKRVGHQTLKARRSPSPDAALDTEFLPGEPLRVFEETPEGWAWVQSNLDGYVGYVASDGLVDGTGRTSHVVVAPMTLMFSAPDIKRPVLGRLPLASRIAVSEIVGAGSRRLAALDNGAFVPIQHVAAADALPTDWVAIAEQFLGVPYLWGGKTHDGADCSGLVQAALAATGRFELRDSDMLAATCGEPVDLDLAAPEGLERGDLLFWDGHMGTMLDGTRLLHANANHMMTAIEPVTVALERIGAAGLPLRAVRRIASGV